MVSPYDYFLSGPKSDIRTRPPHGCACCIVLYHAVLPECVTLIPCYYPDINRCMNSFGSPEVQYVQSNGQHIPYVDQTDMKSIAITKIRQILYCAAERERHLKRVHADVLKTREICICSFVPVPFMNPSTHTSLSAIPGASDIALSIPLSFQVPFS